MTNLTRNTANRKRLTYAIVTNVTGVYMFPSTRAHIQTNTATPVTPVTNPFLTDPHATPAPGSPSRDAIARTMHANTARSAPSRSSHRHDVEQVEAMLSARIQARLRHSTTIAVAFVTGIEGKCAGLRILGAAKNRAVVGSSGFGNGYVQRTEGMKTLEELRRWAHSAPAGTMLSAAAIAAVLEQLEAEPTAAEMSGETPLPWQVLLWTCDPEVRIGREELLEAVGRPASWLYRHTSTKASPRIPHRKLDGSLTFVVGEVRRWILDREEIVEAGPMERPRLRALTGGR